MSFDVVTLSTTMGFSTRTKNDHIGKIGTEMTLSLYVSSRENISHLLQHDLIYSRKQISFRQTTAFDLIFLLFIKNVFPVVYQTLL